MKLKYIVVIKMKKILYSFIKQKVNYIFIILIQF